MLKKLLLFTLLITTPILAYAEWGQRLTDAFDVDKTAPTDTQALLWGSTNEIWAPGDVVTPTSGALTYLKLNQTTPQTITGGAPNFSSAIDFTQIATPANPPAGSNRLYFKNDDKLYQLTSGGSESLVGGGGGSSVSFGSAGQIPYTNATTDDFSYGTGLSWNPATSTLTATNITGDLTGNVTGNVSGNAGTVTNGVYTTDAGTVFLAPNGDGQNLSNVIHSESDPLSATKALDNIASCAINTSLLSDTADTDSLGSADKEWLNLYIGDAGKIYLGLGQDTSIHRSGANEMTLTASSGVKATNFISTASLGTSPYACTSNTLNTNLNADLLDGQHGTYYAVATDYLKLDQSTPQTVTGGAPNFSGGADFGTLSLSSGSITDSSGAISFGNGNLSTTGTLGASSLDVGTSATYTSNPIASFYVLDNSLPQTDNLNFAVTTANKFTITTSAVMEDPSKGDEFAPHNMTSDVLPTPYVVAENSFWSLGGYGLFDDDTSNDFWIGTSLRDTGTCTEWISLDIGAGNTKFLWSYGIRILSASSLDRAPKTWTFEGSNDNLNWNVIDTVASETTWNNDETKEFVCDTLDTAYRYFRINITANNGDASYVEFRELYLYEGLVSSTTPDLVLGAGTGAEHLTITNTGAISIINQLTSTLADGTAPFVLTSTTVNTNLNADLLDGQHGSYYAAAADYLKLDQSNAQTIENGAPIFDSGITLNGKIMVLGDLGAELLTNTGFETNTGQEYPPNGGTATGWVSTGEIYTEGWWPHAGSWGMHHYCWLGSAGECYQEVAVTGGGIYTYTIWTKQDDPDVPDVDIFIKLVWYDVSDAWLKTDELIIDKSADYVQQTLTAVAPVDATKVRVLFGGPAGGTKGSAGFDDASFKMRSSSSIDSLADGYLDIDAPTGIRLRIGTTDQLDLTDGKLAPTTDNDIDLGDSTHEFKDLYVDGVGYIDEIDCPVIKSATGAISFDNENLSTTGTLGAGVTTITGSTNDGTTNIFVGRNSDEANVATLDTNGKMSLTSDAVAVKPTATIVIASSTSRGKDAADYVCDGTNDEVQIQAAINSLPAWAATPATFGGEIKLLEGHYSIGATITVDRSIQIIGCGSGQQTVLELAAGANCDMFQLSPGTGNHSFPLAKFSDLMLDGNAANQDVASYAIDQADESAYDFYCINVWFNDWKGSSLHLTADYDHRIERCVFENQTTYAIDLERIDTTTDTAPMRMWITNCFAPTIYSHGAGTVLVQDLIIDNNIFVPQFDDRTAMNLSGVANLHVTNNSSLGETTTDNTYDWLSLDKAPILGSVIISNNTVRNGKWRYVVNLSGVNASASDSVLINGNTFHEDDGTTVIFNDANNIISGLTISNNIIQTQNDDSMTAIDVGAVNMAKIFGNHFQDGAVGIDISDATSDDVTIYGNSFDGLTTEITSSGDASHPALIYGNKSSASDTSVFVVSNAGKVQVNSAGDDKNVQLYHDDTNGQIVTSSGNLILAPNGTTVQVYPKILDVDTIQNYNDIVLKTYDGDSYNAALTVHGAGGTQTIQMNAYGAGALTTDASGNIVATSDERQKDIQGNFTRGLKDLKDISPIFYKWKPETGYDTEHVYAGLSAQNVQKNIPEAVMANEEGYLGLQDRPIIATLINAINEQQKEIDTLKARLDKLEQATEEKGE